MASIYDDIRKALETKLAGISGIPEIAWENVTFDPTTGTPYIKARFYPTLREPAHRGLNPQMLYRGLFQLQCCVPEGLGPSAADTLANLVLDNFEATSDITNGSTIVSIRYAERERGMSDGTHFVVPVNISWYIYA
jgi:hypothetical protein